MNSQFKKPRLKMIPIKDYPINLYYYKCKFD